MLRLTLMTGLILATVAGCSLTGDAPPIAVQPDRSSVCTALGPEFPLPVVTYNTTTDSAETVTVARAANVQYRAANARFKAACG